MGRKKNRTTTTSSSNTTARQQFDPFITDASRDAITQAQGIASRDYTPYTGDRVAGLSENETRGIQLAGQGYDESRDYIRRGALGFNEAFNRGDLDPYMENLANPIIEDINRDYTDRQQSLESQAAQIGAFGNSRLTMERGALERNYLEDVRDTRRGAFDRAIGVFQNDQSRLTQAGGALAGIQSQEIQELMSTGRVDRVLRQADLDFDYGQFLEARDWDVNNLMPLLNTLSSVPKNVTNTSSTQSRQVSENETQGDTFGQILGAAATVAGAYFTGGASLLTGAGASALGGAADDHAVTAGVG